MWLAVLAMYLEPHTLNRSIFQSPILPLSSPFSKPFSAPFYGRALIAIPGAISFPCFEMESTRPPIIGLISGHVLTSIPSVITASNYRPNFRPHSDRNPRCNLAIARFIHLAFSPPPSGPSPRNPVHFRDHFPAHFMAIF